MRGKLEEERIEDRVKIRLVEARKSFKVGPFEVEVVPLSHSIPEANALVIGTPAGKVFHTGDWKLDPTPVIGQPATPEELAAVIAVLQRQADEAASLGRPEVTVSPRTGWDVSARGLRRPLEHGAGAWARSLR